MKKEVLIGGLQSTNALHIGNYFGSLVEYKNLVKKYDTYLFVADLHALTPKDIDNASLYKNKLNLIACFAASGFDFSKATIFFQSDVAAHTQLGWVLTCHTTLGELNKMTQFKDKSAKSSSANGTEFIPTGLLVYPPLMAADILLYDAKYVYVGIDQKQHVELTRNIATRFNNKYGKTFVIPEHLYTLNGEKINDLVDPTIKMSKSAKNPNGVIFMSDDLALARKKIMSALTDNFNKVKFNQKEQPGISNLVTIYSLLTGMKIADIEKKYANAANYGVFKKELADILVDFLSNFQKKYADAMKNINKYLLIVDKNGKKCNTIANKKVNDVYKKINLIK